MVLCEWYGSFIFLTTAAAVINRRPLNFFLKIPVQWPRQESNLDLELRKLLYYPLYYKAMVPQGRANLGQFPFVT